jgi:hypothetical protein
MKKSIVIAIVVYCGICVVVFEACCKKKCTDPYNPECPNYDPCYKAKPFATFVARQSCWDGFGGEWDNISAQQRYFTDTIGAANVDFLSLYDGRAKCK